MFFSAQIVRQRLGLLTIHEGQSSGSFRFRPISFDTGFSRRSVKARTERRNWTELIRFSFWRTDQWASTGPSRGWDRG